MAKTRRGLDNAWSNASVLHVFTGTPETFDYLLNKQDHFLFDLNDRNSLGMSVENTQLNLYLSWPHSAANARLTLHAVADIQKTARDKNIFRSDGSTYLHHAVSRIQLYQVLGEDYGTYLSDLDKRSHHQNRKSSELLIVDLLKAGADIHASNDAGETPLCIIAENWWDRTNDFAKYFIERMLIWFRLLRDTGYELQGYIETEAEMHPEMLPSKKNKIFPSDYFPLECYPGCQAVHRAVLDRSNLFMIVEQQENTGSFLVNFKMTYTQVEDEGHHSEWVPGSWSSSIETKRTEKVVHLSEATFFIRRLVNGAQDFGVWKEPTTLKLPTDDQRVDLQRIQGEDGEIYE